MHSWRQSNSKVEAGLEGRETAPETLKPGIRSRKALCWHGRAAHGDVPCTWQQKTEAEPKEWLEGAQLWLLLKLGASSLGQAASVLPLLTLVPGQPTLLPEAPRRVRMLGTALLASDC